MHKEMESSVFFSIFQLMQFMKYQGMKRMEELDIKPSQAGILFSLKCWGEQSQRQLAQRVGDYSTVYDSRTSQDGRKRLCKP